MDNVQQALFICYSHTDTSYKNQFDKFLQGGVLRDIFSNIFSDADIRPGEQWQERIADALHKATAALVLVSQDFMISPFIQQVELRELLTAEFRRGLRLFLVPVRSTYYEGTYLQNFQWARSPDKPLSLLPKEEQEAAMVEVCKLIAKELAKPTDIPTIEHTIKCLESIPKLDLPAIYELQGFVGEGEYARCYLAKDRPLERPVLIKVLHEELSRDSAAYDRYVRSVARLHHRNIVGVFFSQTNKLPHFIVTPATEGKTLKERLDESGEPRMQRLENAIQWTRQLASALHYAHLRKCVHGRLRPDEVRFDSENQPILGGFRTVESCELMGLHPPGTKLSMDDFWYASPETRRDGTINAKTDQYLLGLMAYEMLAGRRPVEFSSWASLLDPAVTGWINNPTPLHEVVPDCDERLSGAIMRALASNPEDRWRDIEEMVRHIPDVIGRHTCFEAAKASYRRCAQTTAFYETVYARLFEMMPKAKELFAKVPLQRQYDVLRDSIWLLLTYPNTNDSEEPTILSGVTRTHKERTAAEYDLFRDAVLAAVAQHDSPLMVEHWRDAMAPGFQYLKSKASKASSAAASGT
jgi:serine/threonine protein kinase